MASLNISKPVHHGTEEAVHSKQRNHTYTEYVATHDQVHMTQAPMHLGLLTAEKSRLAEQLS